MKFLPSPTARKFELELFKFCKLNEEAQTANAGVLLWELEKMGITREDARMKPIIEILRRLRRFFPLAFKVDTFSGHQSSLREGKRCLERMLWPQWSSTSSSLSIMR